MNVSLARPGVASPADYVALCKPRITLMVTATGVAGALGARVPPNASSLYALTGTLLIVAGANVLNMWLERDSDALMERTRNRPLAAGRIASHHGLLFGLLLSLAAIPLLAACNVLVASLGVAALVIYAGLYTPLKRLTMWALPIGAIAGAMPPAMGRVAAIGAFDRGALYLFAVLFAWQLPHFVAIAMARADEYARAGLAVGATRARWMLMVSAVLFVLITIPAAPVTATTTGLAFLVLCTRAVVRGAPKSRAREVFAFTMGHLAVLLVAMRIE
jgi:heme o synthase